VNKKNLISNFPHKNVSFNILINKLVKKKLVNFFINDTGYLSISDLKRLKLSKLFFKNNYILTDRDGVLNEKSKIHYYIRNLKELKINYTFVKKLKKIINNRKLLCISNQAGISTGDLSYINLKKINNKITSELKKNGIILKEFFISPHHYNSNNFYRKPNHGMFLRVARKYNLILDRTFYIGDDIRDIEAAYNAKTKCLYIGSKKLSVELRKKFKNILI